MHKSKSILVFGATSAIAVATMRLFAGEEARFFLVGRDEKKLEIVKLDLLARGADFVYISVADLLDRSKHQATVAEAAKLLDGLDLIMVAHGSLGDQAACEKDFETAYQEISLNFLSAASILTYAANYCEEKRSGMIVALTSPAGERGRKSNYVYGAAKGGLTIFLQGLRNRLHHCGVKVLTVIPGFTDTPMTREMAKNRLFVKPEVAAAGIYRAIKKERSVAYVPYYWQFIMLVIKHVPEFLFKRLHL